MGWGSGAILADEIWDTVKKYLPYNRRQGIAQEIVKIFESEDCDTMLETRVGEEAGIECTEELGSHWGKWHDE